MKSFLWNQNKFGVEESTTTSKAFHHAIRAAVRDQFEASGLEWKDFVFGKSQGGLTEAVFSKVEADYLATGRLFDVSATISAKEAPEKYRQVKATTATFEDSEVKDGRMRVGQGDNVVTYPKSITGIALFVQTADEVMEMMMGGVPAETIAIIDDSGGTLTAPILEHFKGVVCMGGTVRSHLGILCREYGIPCLMNAKIGGIKNGDRLELDCAATAKSAQDYQQGVEKVAQVWKLV